MESTILGFLGGIVAAALIFIGSILNTFGRSRDASKEILTRTVTNERTQWRNDIRELSSEFLESSLRVATDDPQGSEFNLEKLGVLIRLRLNPWDDFDIRIACNTTAIEYHAKTKNIDVLRELLGKFERNMRVLLKQEWDKSKREAELGILDVPTSESKEARFKGQEYGR